MARTNNSTDSGGSSENGGMMGRVMDFLKEPLGMGLVAGIAITLGLGYYIL